DERLLAAARTDNLDLLLEVFEQGGFDINCQDSLGNTRKAAQGSTEVLEHILSHEDCDVDPVNRIERETPLHLAVKLKDEEVKSYVVESLLDAGADTTIKNKYGETALDSVSTSDQRVRALLRKAQASASVSHDDVASDDDEDGDGSGSEE
ncbi:hypothetical protein AMATHDRAFT_150600, partial [Amanita thiersii Skay4041]